MTYSASHPGREGRGERGREGRTDERTTQDSPTRAGINLAVARAARGPCIALHG